MTDFVHLSVRSAYSLCRSMLSPEQIAALCKAYSMPAVGVADLGNLFGALEISEKLAKAGIQPLVGMTVGVDFRDGRPGGPLTLYAMNEDGYRNLMALACIANGITSNMSRR